MYSFFFFFGRAGGKGTPKTSGSSLEVLWDIIVMLRKKKAYLIKITTHHHRSLESILITVELVLDMYFHLSVHDLHQSPVTNQVLSQSL